MTVISSDIIAYEQASKIGDAIADALESDKIKKKISSNIEDLAILIRDEIQYKAIESQAEYFEWFARNMAENIVKAILDGNEKEMRRYLSLDGYTGRDRNHPVIHGTLFETGAIELRKKICDAYPETLKNERILDLESQVSSLVDQVNGLEARNRKLSERNLSLEPRF